MLDKTNQLHWLNDSDIGRDRLLKHFTSTLCRIESSPLSKPYVAHI